MALKQIGMKFSDEMLKEIDSLRNEFIDKHTSSELELNRSEFIRYVIRLGMKQIKDNLQK